MPSLKSLKVRIASVKSTQKITKAMKMVAAAKLRRSQEAAEAARPYAQRMDEVVSSLAARASRGPGASPLLVGNGRYQRHLLVICTSDRGLAGGFNTNIVRFARQLVEDHLTEGMEVQLYLVGRKGRAQLARDHAKRIAHFVDMSGIRRLAFTDAQEIAQDILRRYAADEFDMAHLFFSRFHNVLSQEPTYQRLIPVLRPEGLPQASRVERALATISEAPATGPSGVIEYEPDEEAILADLLPRNIAVQIFRALLENQAGFYGSQMSAMDNATRNAGDVIQRLTLTYNRTRQAAITKELIEIISGAEAL